jgi:hypothetical protein
MKSKWLKWILAGGALVAVIGAYGVSIVQASTGLGSLAGPKVAARSNPGTRWDLRARLGIRVAWPGRITGRFRAGRGIWPW